MNATKISRSLHACILAAVAATLAVPAEAHETSAGGSAYNACRRTKLTNFDGTIVEAAIATPALSTLKDLVIAANLVDALNGPGPFTVYAPTNDAFAKIPAPVLSALGSDTAVLTEVLTYHVVASRNADPRRPLSPREVTTLQGQSVFLEYDKGPQVNQSTAACEGVRTSNGIVWIIDSVLLPQFK
ncbi:fasciclin domain-containing protein [Methyloterricola oryzae]|uniref:fasciclin domain-containing protein n=1 Tax=Methyloterricola oryzae TaxID=1495050 RepID=UPI000A81824F|nr:fasciclin domain-containing protein [Methyloterricola oryzae]